MKAEKWFEWIDQHQRKLQAVAYPLILVLIALVTLLVVKTGGIKFVYSHSMYIPILLAGFVFGWRGGILIGLICGFALGPFMPISVMTGELQQPENWLYRCAIFTLIGFFAGLASDSTRSYQRKLRWLLKHNNGTRLPNRVALLKHLDEIESKLSKRSGNSFLLVDICCENEVELKSAFGSQVVQEVVLQLSKRFGDLRQDALVYHTEPAQISVLFKVQACKAEHSEEVNDQHADSSAVSQLNAANKLNSYPDHDEPDGQKAHHALQDTDNDHQEVNALIQCLLECANEPVVYNQVKIHVDISMGYHCFELGDSNSPQKSMDLAESALTAAKQAGLEVVAYSPEITIGTEKNINLLGELKQAIKNGELALHYQPKLQINTGCIYGVEALLRWHHPIQGNIPPSQFIPRAEQSTLIEMITEFVLKQAISQLAVWQKAGTEVCVSVNVSTRNLLQPGFTDSVAALLREHQISGELLELEITEGSLMLDIKRAVDELNKIRDLGVLISIDDFGTGYSSLQYLHRLPISVLKIDQSFVRRLPNDQGAIYILEAAIMLAHNLGISAIAEGVETQEIYECLQKMGCDKAQGYLISRPISAPDFTSWYQAHHGLYPLRLS